MEKFELVAAQWSDSWLLEFVSDMVATYLVGPAFGWQHIRLCSGISQSVYHPAVGEAAVHPADEARFRGIIAVLKLIGSAGEGGQAEALWRRYVSATWNRRPADCDACYSQTLLVSHADRVVTGCQSLGLQGFDGRRGRADDVIALLDRAWARFLADLQAYSSWEE